jgi:hypothetical protein
VLGSRVTLGALIGFESISGDANLDLTSIVLGARVGGTIPLGSKGVFWLKGGITWAQLSENSSSVSFVDLTLDPMFVYFPARGVGLMIGPIVDLGLAGSTSGGTDQTLTDYGFAAGIGAFL